MPQSSIAYAVGRVRAAARKPLGEAQLGACCLRNYRKRCTCW